MRRPRVKLITLPWELEVPTLGLASLAAVTPDRFDIAIVDLLRERLDLDEPVDLVGISASTPRINAAYVLADLYRGKGVKVVIGGRHASALPNEALVHADAVVVGEGEPGWAKICDQFLSDPSKIGGIYREPAPDLATLPQPRIDLLRFERYGRWYYPVTASRGCPEACNFCFAKKMTAGWRTFPIAHVLEQVRRRPQSVRAMYFVDDNLPADADFARELLTALRKWRVPFGMQARFKFTFDSNNLGLAADAGCTLVSSGYESVDQQTLDRVGKRAHADEYLAGITRLFGAGIVPSGNFMFGFDTHTPAVFADMLDFLDRSDLLHISLTAEIPFPGTATWRRYRKEGRLLTEDYAEYVGKDHVVVQPLQMTPAQCRDGIRWLATRFWSVPRATRRLQKALGNPRMVSHLSALERTGMLVGLNAFQVWQWHYRMVPSLQWLCQRLVSVNKYCYFQDMLRRSNFTAVDPPRALDGEDPVLSGPFARAQGWKATAHADHVATTRVRTPYVDPLAGADSA
jgi:radical SAM superfamily enzyme YgiQ (UPF0313 family)